MNYVYYCTSHLDLVSLLFMPSLYSTLIINPHACARGYSSHQVCQSVCLSFCCHTSHKQKIFPLQLQHSVNCSQYRACVVDFLGLAIMYMLYVTVQAILILSPLLLWHPYIPLCNFNLLTCIIIIINPRACARWVTAVVSQSVYHSVCHTT